jgi:hypothetical protein
MIDINALRDMSPLFVLCLTVYIVLPNAVKLTMGIIDTNVRGRLELAAQPLEILKTSLETSSKDREMFQIRMDALAMEFMGVKTRLDHAISLLEDLVHHVKKEQIT